VVYRCDLVEDEEAGEEEVANNVNVPAGVKVRRGTRGIRLR
jgi:hypothetical protein